MTQVQSTKLIISGLLVTGVLSACSDDDPAGSQLVASAGNDKNILVDESVTLDGSGSSDSQGKPFEFSWRFISKPGSSNSQLTDSDSEKAGFVPDVQGKYRIELAVTNDTQDLDTVTFYAYKVIEIAGSYDNLIPGSNVGVRVFESALGKLFATCEFTEIGGIAANKIASYSGVAWSALGCGLEDGSIFGMAEYKGELYVTGEFDEIGCIPANNIAKWDGAGWHALGNGLTGGSVSYGYALSVYDGELYVGGQFTMAGDKQAINIARWDGTNWSAVGTLGGGSVRVLHVYKQKLYAGGYFTKVNGNDSPYLSAYDGSNWSNLGGTTGLELRTVGAVKELAVFKDVLYISGNFTPGGGGDEISELSTWNGSQFSDFGRAFTFGSGNSIRDLKVINDVLYIGGKFNSNVVATPAKSILQWDGESWGMMDTGISGTVLSIESYGNKIYIGGDFDAAGGTTAENISIWTEE